MSSLDNVSFLTKWSSLTQTSSAASKLIGKTRQSLSRSESSAFWSSSLVSVSELTELTL